VQFVTAAGVTQGETASVSSSCGLHCFDARCLQAVRNETMIDDIAP
jgi:hypothetical protein